MDHSYVTKRNVMDSIEMRSSFNENSTVLTLIARIIDSNFDMYVVIRRSKDLSILVNRGPLRGLVVILDFSFFNGNRKIPFSIIYNKTTYV